MLEGLFGQRVQGIFGKLQFGVFHLEEFLILPDERIFGFCQDIDKCAFIERRKDRDDGHPADKFGNHSEFDNVFGDDLFENMCQLGLLIGQLRHFRTEADHFFA